MCRKGSLALAAAMIFAIAAAEVGHAHDGVVHASEAEASAHLEATNAREEAEAFPALPFPVDLEVGFDLIDQNGDRRTEADYFGKPMAIFFGYANCEAICSVALPRIAAAIDLLGGTGDTLKPIMITVDPDRDTPETMKQALGEIHPRLIGLTGDDEHLAAARAAFQVEAKQVTTDPDGRPIYAHGSFIYLIGPDGKLESVIPPVLGPERIAQIMRAHFYAP